jgi:hypothetical protein
VRDAAAKRRQDYILTYATAALQSGRLTLEKAVEEARTSWNRQTEAERQAAKMLQILDVLDGNITCPSCKRPVGSIHLDHCTVSAEASVTLDDCLLNQEDPA